MKDFENVMKDFEIVNTPGIMNRTRFHHPCIRFSKTKHISLLGFSIELLKLYNENDDRLLIGFWREKKKPRIRIVLNNTKSLFTVRKAGSSFGLQNKYLAQLLGITIGDAKFVIYDLARVPDVANAWQFDF